MEHAESKARITHTAMGHGLWNMLVCSITVLIAWAALTALLSLTLDSGDYRPSELSWYSLWAIASIGFFGSWIYGLRNRGRILLDCGPYPMWLPSALLASLMIFGTLLFLLPNVLKNTGDPAGEGLAFLLYFTSFCLIQALSRLQVCERGIWAYCGLIPWSRIDTYQWKDEATLAVMPGTRFPLFRGVIPVPPPQKDELIRLLEHRGNAKAAPPS